MPPKSGFKFTLHNLEKYLSSFGSTWQEVDWCLLLLVIGLTIFGGISIRSTEISEQLNHGFQHWYVGGIGLGIAIMIASWRYQMLLQLHWLIYGFTNISLIAVMTAGVTAKGAQRWLSIGGFNIQPSEFAKIGIIITLAALLQEHKTARLSQVAKTLAITAIPWVLVFLQPDLGTSLVFGAIVISMLYWANVNPAWLLLLISPLVSAILYHVYLPGWLVWTLTVTIFAWFAFPLKTVSTLSAIAVNSGAVELGNFFWSLLQDYQKDRLVLFLNPEQDPLGGGYHLIQSRIAIGSGEMWGQGLHQGLQTQLNFIPEQHTDFIFSAVGEEWGFVGCMVLLLIYWLICLRLVGIASTAKDDFGSLLTIGVLSMIVFQVVVNISMTIGLAPITGIPLPWMSYGRSALLTNFIALGLVESVANYRERKKNSRRNNSHFS